MYLLVLAWMVQLWPRSQVKVGSPGRISGLGFPPLLHPKPFHTDMLCIEAIFLHVTNSFYNSFVSEGG